MRRKIYLIPLAVGMLLGSCKKHDIQKVKDETPAPTMVEPYGGTTNYRLSRLPFDWTTVPVGADIGDITRPFSTSEVEFLGRQFRILSIEKLHGNTQYSEDGFLDAANAIKASNPQTAILYYWNAKLLFPNNYRVAATADPAWLRPNPILPGTFFYKMESAACRTWWVRSALTMFTNNNVDGIFVDGLTTVYEDHPQAAIALLQELKDSLNKLSGAPRVIFYNSSGSHSATGECLANENITALHPLLRIADGAYFEGFYWTDLNRNVSTADLTHALKSIQFVAKKKKSVIVKAWPKFSFLGDNYLQTHSYEAVVARARQEINFPLAAFLVAAGQYSYFQYSWSWAHSSPTDDHGLFFNTPQNSEMVDPYWYAQLRRPLGRPLENANINGDVWTRRFAHATVSVNLQAKTAAITWNITDVFPRG